jgi:hypothetical protein
MPTYALSKDGRMYVQKQTVYNEFNNTGNVATLGATDACKHISFSCTPDPGETPRPDKEENATHGFKFNMLKARASATWEASMALRGSTAAGTAPDIGPFLEALFGVATPNGSTDITYTLEPTAPTDPTKIVALSLWGFRLPATVTQWGVLGALVNTARFTVGQNVAQVSFGGPALWALSNDQWDTAETWQKGDLSAFPSEPGTQTYTGSEITGVAGEVTINSEIYTTLRSASLNFDMQRAYDMQVFNSVRSGANPYEGTPNIGLDITIADTDAAALIALKKLALARTAVPIKVKIGNVAANMYEFTYNDVILPYVPTLDESDRRAALTFTGCRAQATSDANRNECSLKLT